MHQLYRTLLGLLGVGAAVLLAGNASANEIFVDSFDETNPSQQVQLPTPPINSGENLPQDLVDSDRRYAPDALGDDRALSISATSVPTPENAQAEVNGESNSGRLSISRTAGVTDMVTTVLWDGNEDGLGGGNGFDITNGGANDGLLVGFPVAIAGGLDITVNLRSVNDSSDFGSSLSMQVADGGLGDVFFPFKDFEQISGLAGPADLTALLSIAMVISDALAATVVTDAAGNTPAGTFNALIDYVKSTTDPNNSTTPVALPATLPLLMVGLAGIRLVRRGRTSLS